MVTSEGSGMQALSMAMSSTTPKYPRDVMTPMMNAAKAASSLAAISAVPAVRAVAVVGTAHAQVGKLQADAELHGAVRGDLIEIGRTQGIARQEGEQLLAPGPHGAGV